MLLESQDVVGESGPSQFDCEPSAAMMAAVRAELPRPPALDKSADFRASGDIGGARSWLQRAHIQRDEAEPPRRASSHWTSRNAQRTQALPSASAMVLARKRMRDEQRKLLTSKKQCTDSDSSECNAAGSECNAADSERDSLDMEEQLTAFVEYNDTDMDSLDINPSQDFDGGEEQHEAATQASQYMQTCSWQDVTDVNQFQEEASEVFDNIIYAPPPTSVPAVCSASAYCEPQGNSVRGSSHQPHAIPKRGSVISPPSDDSESSLSDGFDIASKIKSTVQPSTVDENRSKASPRPETKPQWRQRRSVKRDCSFIDGSNFAMGGRLLLMALPAPVSTSKTSEASLNRVIELKDGCFDSSDSVEEVPMRDMEDSRSVPSSMPATVDTMTVMSPSFASSAESSSLSMGFQPRLVRKRRRVGQLTLDGFFRSKS